MVSAATSAAFTALSTAFTAVVLFPFLDLKLQPVPGTPTSTPASTLDSAVQIPLLLSLFMGVAFVHRRLHPAAAGAGTELATLVVCTAVSLLELVFFVLPAGVVDDVGALVGVVAADALPAAATVTFFLGITLVIAHIRAGGEGGGGAVADDRRVVVPVDLLKKLALVTAGGLLVQMAMALYFK